MKLMKLAKSYLLGSRNSASLLNSMVAVIGITIGITSLIVVSSVMNGITQEIYSLANVNGYDVKVSDKKEELNDILLSSDLVEKTLLIKVLDSGYKALVQNVVINLRVIRDEDALFETDALSSHGSASNIPISFYKKRGNGVLNDKMIDHDVFKVREATLEEKNMYSFGRKTVYIKESVFKESLLEDIPLEKYRLVSLKDFLDAENFAVEITAMDNSLNVDTWSKNKKNLLQTLALESAIIKIVLFFVILMSCFNIVSTLTLIITEKKQDVYILKTLGYSNLNVLFLFLFCGFILGFFGIILGSISGTVITLNLKEIMDCIEQVSGIRLVPVLIEKYPVIMSIESIIKINIITIIIVLLASLLPSLKTLRITPAEGLRNE